MTGRIIYCSLKSKTCFAQVMKADSSQDSFSATWKSIFVICATNRPDQDLYVVFDYMEPDADAFSWPSFILCVAVGWLCSNCLAQRSDLQKAIVGNLHLP